MTIKYGQRFIPLPPETTLFSSDLSARKNSLHTNPQKYFNGSPFNELIWINVNQNKIEFYSLHNST